MGVYFWAVLLGLLLVLELPRLGLPDFAWWLGLPDLDCEFERFGLARFVGEVFSSLPLSLSTEPCLFASLLPVESTELCRFNSALAAFSRELGLLGWSFLDFSCEL